MKAISDLAQENISNLTSLWRTVADKAQAHTSGEDFDFSSIDYSEWPNRLWFHHDLDQRTVGAAKNQLLSTPVKLVIPYWDIYQSGSYQLLEASGFELQSEQIGMSLRLAETYEKVKNLSLEKVSNNESAMLWEQLFMQAFGYKISHQLLLLSGNEIDYLIAYHDKQPIGTAILYHQGNTVIGIHSMGIIPEMRRKGFAEQMMVNLLHWSTAQQFTYATLQASAMGKGLYLKLGFEEQFTMKNYSLRQ